MSKALALTKREALELLSKHLRRTDIETESFLKVMDAYAKLNGWDKTKPPSPNSELSLDELVEKMEKKRKKA